jgi:hypothetical protein
VKLPKKFHKKFPNYNDKLICWDVPSKRYNACLNYTGKEFHIYSYGYQKAAERVIQSALHDQEPIDILIYPIIFLYRQFLELRLKELIICLDSEAPVENHHHLLRLWQRFISLVEQTDTNPKCEEFEATESLIREFTTLDPHSMVFRYPVDKKGEEHKKPDLINIINLAEVMYRTSFFLECIRLHFNSDATNQKIYNEVYYDFFKAEGTLMTDEY